MKSALYTVANAKNIKKEFLKQGLKKPNLIISSPPYFDMLNYDNIENQIGYGQNTYEEYLETISKVFQDCYNISSSGATFWLIVDTFKKRGEVTTLPFDIYNKLKNKFYPTWKLKEIIIWNKEKNIPWNNRGTLKNQFEYILFFVKNNKFKFKLDRVREINDLKKWWLTYPERYNPKGKAPSNLWSFNIPIRGWGNGYQNHLCPFPFPLVEKIINIATNKGDMILDPFAGSGTVLAMATQMDRYSFGLDINANYKKLFKEEVLLGAKKYWEIRKSELLNNKRNINNFESTIEKLRKLKLGSLLGTYINAATKKNNLNVIFDNSNSKITLLSKNKNGGSMREIDLAKTIVLIKQAKINYAIKFYDEDCLKSKLKNVKLYRYSYKKFYSYISTSSISQAIKNTDPKDYFYSNIRLKFK